MVDPKQARLALIQFALWGVALAVIGGSIAAATWPHADGLGRYSGDETGFWFGVVIAWLGTCWCWCRSWAGGRSWGGRPGACGAREFGRTRGVHAAALLD